MGTETKWEVNYDRYVKDSATDFQWTIYTASKSRTPDFTYWTTNTSWKQVSSRQVKKQLGTVWKLVPTTGRYYFYEFATPSTAWFMGPATMVGVQTSAQNGQDNKRLVKDIIYATVAGAPIFLTTVPLQLISITTNQNEQAVTYTWKPLFSSNSS